MDVSDLFRAGPPKVAGFDGRLRSASVRRTFASRPVIFVLALALLAAGCASTTRNAEHPRGPTSTTTSMAPTTTSTTTTTTPTTAPTHPSSSLPPPSTTLATSLFGRVWTRIPISEHLVALTFDAGANADGLPSILATLRAAGVPATFFLTGAFAREFPSLCREVASGGYRIGDHSVDHPYFTHLSDSQIRSEVLDAAGTITAVTGSDPSPLFRFPYGDSDARTLSVVNGLGYVAVGWTVDTLGWEGTSGGVTTQRVVDRVMDNLVPGEIVLMHVGSNPTDHSTLDADALPAIIGSLRSAGYSFVTLGSLVGSR